MPGCYGVQIDGTRFSRVVVFEVIYYARVCREGERRHLSISALFSQ